MAGGPSKVWTIKVPQRDGARPPSGVRPHAGGVVRLRTVPDPAARADFGIATARPAHAAWLAYLLGPLAWITVARRSRPRTWLADVLAVPAAMAWIAWRERAAEPLALAAAAVLALWLAAGWARSIAWARSPLVARSRRFAWLANPPVVALLGLLVPGLGLMLARSRKRAAAAVWLVGPAAASWLVLANARRAWPGGGTALEIALATAAGIAVVTAIAWLVQALDGARRMLPSRPLGAADVASAALIAALLLFAVTFRPAALARQLHTTASALQADGYRLIPLALCDAASALDPASAEYAADGARLAERLGMDSSARVRREAIDRRARDWDRAAGPEPAPPPVEASAAPIPASPWLW